MSAYALPGSYFFPKSTNNAVKQENTQSLNLDGSQEKNSNVEGKSKESSPNSSWYSSSNDLLISIKSASIDHIRLIQSFTAFRPSGIRDRVSSISNSFGNFGITSTDSDEQWGEYGDDTVDEEDENEYCIASASPDQHEVEESSNHALTDDQQACSPTNTMHSHAFHSKNSSSETNSHDDAIQFTLSISFNGRKYTATRALPSFVKLRNDLMQEIARSKKSKVRFHDQTTPSQHNQDVFYESREHEEEVVIPELPTDGNIGMTGCGFRGLQETVKNYCPPMESWIRNVAALVPSSPTLANFLWEPLHKSINFDSTSNFGNAHNFTNSLGGLGSVRGSSLTLNSITESTGNEDFDESDETDSENEDTYESQNTFTPNSSFSQFIKCDVEGDI